MKMQAALVVLSIALCPLIRAQNVTVKADAGPDEGISQAYMALDTECNLVSQPPERSIK